ncbi:CRISPR-associated helicase/endonuclease Cas3 [Chitinivibrio alkaliphilus]|uniref:CRISPR-associated helicase Cas3 n=1 Tax=Chitinivibrio alkaliphilus ACht1 TaxID=1313304 RepID=U7D997_9BACT|nr:CRISPR-associated helicase/endonuclease Cas3 [Chitinivibrio alkaliphilus]ERP31667.1 CRISPR-associated helicase Cas3 [Chitinivibrio alkaliphilus ACht1]
MLLAHVRQDESGEWEIHELGEHLAGVAEIAEQCAAPFGLRKVAYLAGITHDFGKASEAFQNKIASQSGYDPEAHVTLHVDHSTAGAQYLVEKYGKDIGTVLAYLIVGHHGGLPNGHDSTNSDLRHRLTKSLEPYRENLPHMVLPKNLNISDFTPIKNKRGKLQLPFLIRMLYSCLVDADFLDTERFMAPEKNKERQVRRASVTELQHQLNQYIRSTFKADSSINAKRMQILEWCRDAAKRDSGLFSLTVPTGGGKTVSSMAFALDHAVKHNLRRVIYVIPYTSIITQNAEVFRTVFGDENVLEHHNNLEPEKETALNRLSSQNWDAPIVVTTNVQFFESFYSNRSSACRKLHNVADSVIIFDEAQMFPPEYLRPSITVIRELVESYGCSAVLCTATQPTLSDTRLLKNDALQNVREIMPEPQKLYNDFKRVQLSYLEELLNVDDLARRLAQQEQVLAIVNTRKDARNIMESLADTNVEKNECFHLSTMMCPEHRKDILQTVRNRLDDGLPCRVVSTQLIEAGVDVDFPVVYRAVAGIDSIAQAAGRCNRNGKLKQGEVFVFNGETPPPPGHLRHAAESGKRILKRYTDDILSIESVSTYFQNFYNKQNSGNKLDKKEIMALLSAAPDKIQFKDMAEKFRIIEEATQSIIVPYGTDGAEVIQELRDWSEKVKYCSKDAAFLPREMQKRAQRFSVQLRKRMFENLAKDGVLEDLFDDGQYWILTNNDIYTENVGLCPDIPEFMNTDSLMF